MTESMMEYRYFGKFVGIILVIGLYCYIWDISIRLREKNKPLLIIVWSIIHMISGGGFLIWCWF